MKKILSIITALSIMVTALLSAVTVTAAEKITADEVRELIYSTGLKVHPEFWDKTIEEAGRENDVLKPETRTVKDVIDINNSYNIFCVKSFSTRDGYKPCYDENGKYQAFGSEQDNDYQYDFYGYDKDGKAVNLLAFPENYYWNECAGTIEYFVANIESNMEEHVNFREDYEAIAESINKSNIKDVADIRVMGFASYGGIYVRDKAENEYAIPAETLTDKYAQSLGREVLTLTQGEVMDFKEWFDTAAVFEKNMDDDWEIHKPKYEKIIGDEVRDTDTRAAYIGTESKFSDVSGDLVSYVNELNDLGIINGYDENLFKPENTITRAEAAAMLTRMLRYSGKYSGEFKDVSADDWFADDVAALVAEGIINGYNETTFAPNENIKYQEVMKILVYALGYATDYMKNFPKSYPSTTNSEAMKIGLTKSLKSFDTTAPITRGDMAVMLSNALDTHLHTYVDMVSGNGSMGSPDITLIDYLNGGKLNGKIINFD